MSTSYGNALMNDYGLSNGTSTATETKRQPQVNEAFIALEQTIEAHQKLASEIEQRLGCVLRQEPEATEGGRPSESSRTVVAVAERINDATRRLHQLTVQYNSILRRLEL